jgi:CIC family chloride channel protein
MRTSAISVANLGHWLDRVQPSETAVQFGTAIAVGAGTGLGAVALIELIALIQRLFFGGGEAAFGFLGRGLIILAPAVGGLLAGPIIAFFAREAKGHGVPEVMQAIALRGGRIRPRVVVAKVVASALCIGSGGSAGREGPIVQVGAALGSTVGQWLRLSEARVRNLVACGAAAGIAATFNAPIAGVLFAIEIILGELQLGDLGSVVISAVTAATIARAFLGDRPAFAIPSYSMKTPWEVLLYAVLGILAACVGVAFIRLLYWFEDRFDGWRFPMALKPAIGGLLLGGLAFLYPLVLSLLGLVPGQEIGLGFPLLDHLPHVFGTGFSTIEGALQSQLSFGLLFALVFLKMLGTSLTLGSGNSGGIFAPSLFMGAALGGAFGSLAQAVAPGATAGPGAFAAVGMAAVFAAAARAPFTAILIVFEMTDDYQLILPLMASVIVSLVIAERLHRESIYTLKLIRRGIHLRRGLDVDVMETVRVDEVMTSQPVTVPASLSVTRLAGEFVRTGRHGFPVLNEDGSLFGMVSLEDYRRAMENSKPELSDDLLVRDIATRNVVSVFPDDSVGTALRRMAPRDLSRLPVVAREDPRRLLGVVRRNDIVRAYEVGAMRREEARLRGARLQALTHPRTEFVDVALPPDSRAAGKTIAELGLPRAAVLVSVRRGRELVIPRGDTCLQASDVVTALCEREYTEQLKAMLGQPEVADASKQ